MTRPADFDSRTVEANGQRIHVAETGAGPLVLLLHGFPESWYSWRHQLAALQRAGYHAVAISGRGYGRSARPTEAVAYRITELVADCVGVVEALGESNAVIVGHDWGAQVAWASAWTRPDVFSAIAALGVAFGGRTLLTLPGPIDGSDERRPSEVVREIAGPGLTFYREYLEVPGVAEREMECDVRGWLHDGYYSYSGSAPPAPGTEHVTIDDLDDEEILKRIRDGGMCITPGSQWRDRFHTAPTTLPPWLSEDVIDFYVEEFERTGFTGALNWYRNADLNWQLLGHLGDGPITVPALYVQGDRDPATMWSKQAVARMSQRVPDLTVHTFDDCGHWIGEERPEETNQVLLEFLARVATNTP